MRDLIYLKQLISAKKDDYYRLYIGAILITPLMREDHLFPILEYGLGIYKN